MRATLDTNVFVSALNFGGIPATILDLHTDEMFTLCASQAIIAELTRVLDERFMWTKEDTVKVTASPDPNDNHILECALESKSDVIVTGHKALLDLGSFEQIVFITPRAFLDQMRNETANSG